MATITLQPVIFTFRAFGLTAAWLIRERVMAEIGQRLRRIQQAEGFLTDCGAAVSYGQLIEAEPPVIPSLNYWDGQETGESDYGEVVHTVSVTVECYDKPEPDPDKPLPDQLTRYAVRMLADVEQALWQHQETGQPDPQLRGLAEGIQYAGSRPILGLQPVLWVGCVSEWDVRYRTKAGDPYRQMDSDE
jgi:hypothetical protein